MDRHENSFTRIGVFYDGQFFSHVSNYYLYHHERKARISISGLHEFVMDAVSEAEGVDKKHCRIVDAHYFRGRLSADQALERDALYRERVWDDILIRAGVTTHFLPLSQNRESGVDVWYALEAFELANYKRFSVSVLVAGDGDYVPLLRKLHTIGTRTMVLAWDLTFVDENGENKQTRTSQALMDEATYVFEMQAEIDARSRKKDPVVAGLFVPRREAAKEIVADHRLGTIVTLQDGYGFIKPDGGGDNLFFHYSYLSGTEYSDLSKGDKVAFVPGKNKKGACALRVERHT